MGGGQGWFYPLPCALRENEKYRPKILPPPLPLIVKPSVRAFYECLGSPRFELYGLDSLIYIYIFEFNGEEKVEIMHPNTDFSAR